MDTRQKIKNLINKKEKINNELYKLQQLLKQENHKNCSDLVGKYIHINNDTSTIIMYVRKVNFFEDCCHIMGPSIINYRNGSYILNTHHLVVSDFCLSKITIVSETEWDQWLNRIKEKINKSETIE